MPSTAVKLRSAIFQGPSATEDVPANLQTMNDVLVEARAMGVDLVLFPELFLSGYDCRAVAFRRLGLDTAQYGRVSRRAALEGGAALEPLVRISDMARECGVAVAFGYCERGEKERFYNSCLLFDAEGSTVLNYRKTHLWDAGEATGVLSHERRIFTPGDALSVADLVLPAARRGIDERIPSRFRPKSSLRRARAITVRVGILICFDSEFPEPARCLAAQGAQIILLPTALGSGPVEVLTPNVTVPQRAAENHVFILYSNLTGPCHPRCGSRMFVGRSAVIGPDGHVVDGARAASDGGDTGSVMLVADLDGAAYASCVARNDYLALRRPELYARSGLGAGAAARARGAAVRSPLNAARAAGVASSKRGYFSRVDSPSSSPPAASPHTSPVASPLISPPLPTAPPPARAAAAAPSRAGHTLGSSALNFSVPSLHYAAAPGERESEPVRAASGGGGAVAQWARDEGRRALEERFTQRDAQREAQLGRKLDESRAAAAVLRELLAAKDVALESARQDELVARRKLDGDVARAAVELSSARDEMRGVKALNDEQLGRLTLQLASLVTAHQTSVAAVEERAAAARSELESSARDGEAARAEMLAVQDSLQSSAREGDAARAAALAAHTRCDALEQELADARAATEEALGREEAARDALVAVCEDDASTVAEPTHDEAAVAVAARTPLPSAAVAGPRAPQQRSQSVFAPAQVPPAKAKKRDQRQSFGKRRSKTGASAPPVISLPKEKKKKLRLKKKKKEKAPVAEPLSPAEEWRRKKEAKDVAAKKQAKKQAKKAKKAAAAASAAEAAAEAQ